MTRFSILHISDLHKTEGTSYKALLQSLLTDRDNYADAGIPAPKYVVVSGDLIHGGNTEEDIRVQYRETKGFLSDVVNEFLNNDYSRLLIVPGNHDVSFPHSRICMLPESETNKSLNLNLYWANNPSIRWSWKDFSFFKIADSNQYRKRFDLFREFYNDFYHGDRIYPDDPLSAAECYSFPNDNVTFALFNSCKELDHLNDTPCIDDNAIVSVIPNLRATYNRGHLNIAIWHHHFYGAPKETNYLDREIITKMSHSYLQIGLFGHQHISQIAEFYGGDLALAESHDNQRLLLISSGTLFGGKKELPEGYKRQYNVIEVTHTNGEALIEIHVREDDNRKVGSSLPLWRTKPIGTTNSIKTSVQLKRLDERELLASILRTAKESGDYKAAYTRLKDCQITGTMYESIRSEVIRGIKDNRFLLDNLQPKTKNDYLLLMVCAEKENDLEIKSRLKTDPRLQAMLDDSVIKELYDRL